MGACRVVAALALLLVVWLAVSLVRVENQRYAMQVGMCRVEPVGWDSRCLSTVETRTSPLWHLFYALGG